MTETPEDFKKLQRKFINEYLFKIQVGRAVVEDHKQTLKEKQEALGISFVGLEEIVKKVFNEVPSSDGELKVFLQQKLNLPHEHEPNCLHVMVKIITKLLTDPIEYGKTGRGGVDQIGFIGLRGKDENWSQIESELVKICNDYFDITPFLDNEKENFPEIGFYQNSIWKNPKERIDA